jgi:hypothetical protein
MPTTPAQRTSFVTWLRSEASRLRKVVGAATSFGWVSAVSIFLYDAWLSSNVSLNEALHTRGAQFFMGGLAAFHSATCFVLVWAMPRPAPLISGDETEATSIAREAARRIQKMVMYLYTSLALLYATYSFFTFKGLSAPKQHWGAIIEILTSTVLFFLYIELSDLTVVKRIRTPAGDGTVTEIAFSSDAQRHRIVFLGLVLLLLLLSVLAYRYPSPPTQFVLRLVVASLSGVTLALVIGRLGSIYINPGAGALSLLYGYAIIQPFAAFFDDVRFDFVITSLALPLKVLLWLVFVWAFTTGKLWEYVREVRIFLEAQQNAPSRLKPKNT